MIQPEADPVHEKSHAHVDMDDLMDASGSGPGHSDADSDIPNDAAHGGDGEEVDVSGESSDAYISGQDAGSID